LDIKAKEIPSVFLNKGYYFDQGYNLREAGVKILNLNYGFTEPSGFWLPGGRQFSTMYLFKPAFSSKNQLISTLGHEYYHSTLLFKGITGSLRHHAAIRVWQKVAERNLGLEYKDYLPRSLNRLLKNFRVGDLMYMPKYKF